MPHLIRTSWTGTSGGLGVTQLAITPSDGSFGVISGSDAQDAVNAARTFWDAIKAYLPNEVVLTVSPVVDYYHTADGSLQGLVSAATPPVVVTGTSTLSYSMAAGLKINWNTGVIRNSRRVRGSTFLVPATNNAFSPTGTTDATAKSTIQTAGAAYLAALLATGLTGQVWSRPLKNSLGVITRDGVSSNISAMEVSEKTAVLRGRRD